MSKKGSKLDAFIEKVFPSKEEIPKKPIMKTTKPRQVGEEYSEYYHGQGTQGVKPLEGENAQEVPKTTKPTTPASPEGKNIPKRKYIKYTQKDLTILLLEESADTSSLADIINNGIIPLVKKKTDNFFAIIRYGEKVDVTPISLFEKIPEEKWVVKSDVKTSAVDLYSALLSFKKIVKKDFVCVCTSKDFFYFDFLIRIANIEIYGVGSAQSTGDQAKKEEATAYFNDLLKDGIQSKYFCLQIEQMKEAASFGFRSIGCLSKEY